MTLAWHEADADTHVLRDETGNTGWVVRRRSARWVATFDGHPLTTRVTFRSGKTHRRIRLFGGAANARVAVENYLAERAKRAADNMSDPGGRDGA